MRAYVLTVHAYFRPQQMACAIGEEGSRGGYHLSEI